MGLRCLISLDFDGVICDSALECLISSWIAYHEVLHAPAPDSVSIRLKDDFLALRPFIRSGEDYLLIHELLEKRINVQNQQGFDSFAAQLGSGRMQMYRKLFYQAREELQKHHREYWMSLNPIYPHVTNILKRYAEHEGLHIVSTKRPDFIADILKHSGTIFPPERIHYAGQGMIRKLDLIQEILNASDASLCHFVDDQIDNLKGAARNIKVWLASWGYVKQEWISNPGDAGILTAAGIERLIKECL